MTDSSPPSCPVRFRFLHLLVVNPAWAADFFAAGVRPDAVAELRHLLDPLLGTVGGDPMRAFHRRNR